MKAKQYKENWIRTVVTLPDDFSADDAEEVGNNLIDFILERTAKGKGSDGQKFPKYEKSYYESPDFIALGKSKNKVDLRFSSEMLDSLQVLSAKKGQVTIGFEEGDKINGRAEGNITGSYGKEANPDKARNFMELSDEEISKVIKKSDISTTAKEARKIANEKTGKQEINQDLTDEILNIASSRASKIINKFIFETIDE